MKTIRWSRKAILPIISIVIALGSCVVSALILSATVIDKQKTLKTPPNVISTRASAVETFMVDKLVIPSTGAHIPYQSRTPIQRAVFTPTSAGTQRPTSTLHVVTDYPTYTPTTAVPLHPDVNSTKTPKKTPIQANTKIVDPPGATALCNDGTYSYSTQSGPCSHHFGVKRWIP